METPRFVTWGGIASFAVGIVWMLWSVAPWAGFFLIIAFLLMLVGLAGLHIRLAKQTPGLSWAGTLVAAVGVVLALMSFSSVFLNAATSSSVPAWFFVGIGGLCLGLALMGLATFQAKQSSRLATMTLVLAVLTAVQMIWGRLYIFYRPNPPLSLVAPWFILGIGVGIAWLALGLLLYSSKQAHAKTETLVHR